MRMADPSPLGETSFCAIVRAICDADPANVCGGGFVESVLTALTQRRCARFFAMDIWTLVLLLHQAKCDPMRDHAQVIWRRVWIPRMIPRVNASREALRLIGDCAFGVGYTISSRYRRVTGVSRAEPRVKESTMATDSNPLNRRGFLKSAAAGAAGAAALGASGVVSADAQLPDQARSAATPVTPEEAARGLASETAPLPVEREVLTVEDPGSDFMVDVLKTLDFEYIAANPASSFRGLHESFITYGGNKGPEWLPCCHEEAAVNIANGYYGVAGKPMAVITFAPSGLQHATMGIFGAFSGHSPTYILCSNIVDGKERRPQYDWGMHSVVDPAAMVRDMVKWDDTPGSLQHFAESAVRAYKMAMTEPRGPVLLVVDSTLQEN